MARRSSGRRGGTRSTKGPAARQDAPVEDAEVVKETPPDGEAEAVEASDAAPEADGAAQVEATPDADPAIAPRTDADGAASVETPPPADTPEAAADPSAGTELVEAPATDLVPPPGPPPEPETPEPTAADAPEVIELGGAEDAGDARTSGDPVVPPKDAGPAEAPAAAPPPPAASSGGGFGTALMAAALAAALAFVAAWFLLDRDDASAERLAALEAQVEALAGREIDLTPVEERIAALEGTNPTFEERLAAVEGAEPDLSGFEQRLAGLEGAEIPSLTGVEGRLAELEGLTAELAGALAAAGAADGTPVPDGAVATDPAMQTAVSEAGSRIDAIAAEVLTLSDRVGALNDRVSGLSDAVEGLPEQVEAVRSEVTGQFETVRSELSGQVEAVAGRVDELEGARDTFQAEAQAAAAEARAEAALRGLLTAIDTGAPFAEELTTYQDATGRSLPTALAERAGDGVTALAALQTQWDDAAREALDAAPADPGPAGFLRSSFGIRSLEAREGDGTDAVLSRANAAVMSGDVETALTEVGTLEGPARDALSDWEEAARGRLEALEAARSLRASTEEG